LRPRRDSNQNKNRAISQTCTGVPAGYESRWGPVRSVGAHRSR
jgi:hypothetical protein